MKQMLGGFLVLLGLAWFSPASTQVYIVESAEYYKLYEPGTIVDYSLEFFYNTNRIPLQTIQENFEGEVKLNYRFGEKKQHDDKTWQKVTLHMPFMNSKDLVYYLTHDDKGVKASSFDGNFYFHVPKELSQYTAITYFDGHDTNTYVDDIIDSIDINNCTYTNVLKINTFLADGNSIITYRSKDIGIIMLEMHGYVADTNGDTFTIKARIKTINGIEPTCDLKNLAG